MSKNDSVLFLSFELSGYFMACINHLADKYQVQVHIIKHPNDPNAPFEFKTSSNVKFYNREHYNQEQLIQIAKTINPSIVICSGWNDKDYLKVSRSFYSSIPTVLIFDNRWKGTVKQKLYSIFAPSYFKKIFSHTWVPGEEHILFAKKLGFKNENILTGMYSADFNHFHAEYLKNREQKKNHFPHRFLYVGRYIELKGVKELWQAFYEWQSEQNSDWELWCIGKGDLESEIPKHDKLKNFGFAQPKEMSKYIAECGVFILPSRKDNWGVVVHEFAAAGFPLICNNISAAAKFFLKDNYNGYFHKARDINSIKEVFNKVAKTSDKELYEMGERSAKKAENISPDTWAETILNLIKN